MKKAISELSPEEQQEQRAKWRNAQTKSRANRKAEQTLTADEWFEQFFGSPQYEETRKLAEQQHDKISEELGIDAQAWSRHPGFYSVDTVLWTLYGFKKNFVREVTEPKGVRVAGLIFPDVIGSHIVADAHRHNLEQSQTFSMLYRELLEILDQRFGKHLSDDPIERRAALDIKAELSGTYALASEPHVWVPDTA
jgi:hypothetical protein